MVWRANTGFGYVKLSHKMYFTDLSKFFLNYVKFVLNGALQFISFGCGSRCLWFWVCGLLYIYGWYRSTSVLLFRGGGGRCGIKRSHILNCLMVLSGKTSLLYLVLCNGWMSKPYVMGFLLAYVVYCWLRCFAVLVAGNLLQCGCMCFVLRTYINLYNKVIVLTYIYNIILGWEHIVTLSFKKIKVCFFHVLWI